MSTSSSQRCELSDQLSLSIAEIVRNRQSDFGIEITVARASEPRHTSPCQAKALTAAGPRRYGQCQSTSRRCGNLDFSPKCRSVERDVDNGLEIIAVALEARVRHKSDDQDE